MCLSVCVSVPQWPLQCELTFDPFARLGSNFQGQPNSLQVIFGLAVWTRGPPKRGFLPSLSPPGVLGQGGCVISFRKQDNKENKMLGGDFWFLVHGPRKRGRKAGLAGWATKILEFQLFYKSDPPWNQAPVAFAFMQLFDLMHPEGRRGTPLSRQGWKSKVKIGVFLIKETVSKIKF